MNINRGNNTIAPNATRIEQHFHITIDLHCDFLTVIANLAFNLLE